MKNKITYTLLLFLVLGSTSMIGQRNNRQQRQMPPTGGEYVLDGNGLVVEDEIPDFTFVSNSSSFNNAVNNEIALKIARDKEKDAWFHKQREIIKEHLENKFNKTFANYDAAKNEMFLYSEKANIVRNKVSPKSKYDRLHSQGYQRTLTYLKDLKLLALRSAEIQAGNIHNSQYGYITVNNVALKDMQNSNSINQHRNTVLIPLENNIATTHTNKHIALKIGNLGSAFEQKMVQQKNNYYYSFNEWDELNYMQFLINYEEIKRLTSVPYYYPQLLELFNKFKDTDQATSPVIENYAIQNRGGGYSIFSQNHFQSLLASAQNNMGQYVDSSDLYASVVEAWEREKEMALESLLENISTEEIIERLLEDNPFFLLDIDCNQIENWKSLAQHTPSPSVKDKVKDLQENHEALLGDWNIQYLENAGGTIVNMDYFAVNITTLPNNPTTGVQFSPEQFLDYFRRNINDFVDGTTFEPYCEIDEICTQETNLWNSDNPIGSIIKLDITINDGVVVCAEYTSDYWRFMTMEAPFDNNHPVSGTRQFGIEESSSGSYNIYVRGVDRFTSNLQENTAYGLSFGNPFYGADNLWESFQQKTKDFINQNEGVSTILAPIHNRPDWDKIKDVLQGIRPISDLGCD